MSVTLTGPLPPAPPGLGMGEEGTSTLLGAKEQRCAEESYLCAARCYVAALWWFAEHSPDCLADPIALRMTKLFRISIRKRLGDDSEEF